MKQNIKKTGMWRWLTLTALLTLALKPMAAQNMIVWEGNAQHQFKIGAVDSITFTEKSTDDIVDEASAERLEDILSRRSPAWEPYEYVSGGRALGTGVTVSPDPMIGYVWDHPTANDPLQAYIMTPVLAYARTGEGNFGNLENVGEGGAIKVNGPGTIVLDFGAELPAWLEIDSPDLSGTVTLGVSEYNEVESYSGHKTKAPTRVGTNTYRLELNSELYEGVRFAFINVEKFDKPFTITAIRAVCQVMPVNYVSSFESDNQMLDSIWYVAAWDVRANLREDCFGAILLDRGDRISWTGDAYTAQAAALVAFANYDAVLKNLRFTEEHVNNIETYELMWVESLIDYYMYSGDREGLESLTDKAIKRLDHAYQIFDNPTGLRFVGWDDRTGTGFDHSECEQNKLCYQAMAIGTWKHFADVLERIGKTGKARLYRNYATRKTQQLFGTAGFISKMGMHAAADAINAGLTDDLSRLYHPDLADRLQRLSYSPFNQCMIIDAMAAAGHHDHAFASIMDMWGGQIAYGGTTFFEVYRPDWNNILPHNGPVPYTQAGHTSLAHPWGAGVLAWLTEEMLGVKPTEPGFSTFRVHPHFCGYARRAKGDVSTPHGTIRVSFDLESGQHTLSVPDSTIANYAIPREGMGITSVLMNGQAVSPSREDEQFFYLDSLAAGEYTFEVNYTGTPTEPLQEEYIYAAQLLDVDYETHGEWYKKYGQDGYFIVGGDNGKDLAVLPDYVESITFDYICNPSYHRTVINPQDPIAKLPVNPDGTGAKVFACYYSRDLHMCPVDIRLKEQHPYTVALYIADCETKGMDRNQSIEVFDLETMNRIAPLTRVNDMKGGVYIVYSYDKSMRIRCNHIRGDNAVYNALFFGKK